VNYFGTDGIRGHYGGKLLNDDFAYSLGCALGGYLNASGPDPSVLLARDTRPSGEKLMVALSRGLENSGCRAVDAGILPTPALSHGVVGRKVDLGVMITASHNPIGDNGFKIFSRKGEKLAIEQERLIESRIELSALPENSGPPPRDSETGKAYLDYVKGVFPDGFLKGRKVVADMANGATSGTSFQVLSHYGAEVFPLHHGEGAINENAGSEHPRLMQAKVSEVGAQLGIAYDGDGDRALFCDAGGGLIHGDKILGLLALDAKRFSSLDGAALVATEHSNSGLEESLRIEGLALHRAKVGDRNVAEMMRKEGCNLGGESSGHVVCSNYLPTGDGLYTSLLVAYAMVRNSKSLKELSGAISLWPSRVGAFPVRRKVPIEDEPALSKALRETVLGLGSEGRVLLRYSGTEPKIRLLVEARNRELADENFYLLASVVEKIL
tara:strand:- start:502 stop:1818 length:1317 start_codon:yes stop_codon:yes gene_type:complete